MHHMHYGQTADSATDTDVDWTDTRRGHLLCDSILLLLFLLFLLPSYGKLKIYIASIYI